MKGSVRYPAFFKSAKFSARRKKESEIQRARASILNAYINSLQFLTRNSRFRIPRRSRARARIYFNNRLLRLSSQSLKTEFAASRRETRQQSLIRHKHEGQSGTTPFVDSPAEDSDFSVNPAPDSAVAAGTGENRRCQRIDIRMGVALSILSRVE